MTTFLKYPWFIDVHKVLNLEEANICELAHAEIAVADVIFLKTDLAGKRAVETICIRITAMRKVLSMFVLVIGL